MPPKSTTYEAFHAAVASRETEVTRLQLQQQQQQLDPERAQQQQQLQHQLDPERAQLQHQYQLAMQQLGSSSSSSAALATDPDGDVVM